MSDARFASLKTDPRFRRPKKLHSKVTLDDRFEHILGKESKSKKKSARQTARVDKYGRTVSDTRENDDLRRFYRLDKGDDAKDPALAVSTVVDYARGAVLMESSDEEEDSPPHVPSEDGSDSDQSGFVSLGVDPKKCNEDEEDVEVDLDENTIATLDAQVAEYAATVPEREGVADAKKTTRLAVVNLDWDYVRAIHLYKIFSSLVSPTAPLAPASISHAKRSTPSTGKSGVNVARGRVLSVRVYPSEFGKARMAKEEKEGPQLFGKKNRKIQDGKFDEKTVFETGTEADYDEDALRKYQLERLRYYYAIVECDTVEAASHLYNELEGSELERSANIIDLSFVPDDMMFDDEPRDEATQLSDAPYRALEFVTDALRHSKVKLTWDEDDPERNHILRRLLTKKEIDEGDFRAYIASSSSSEGASEDEAGALKNTGEHKTKNEEKASKGAERERLRTLLLGGDDDELPEDWGDAFDNKESRRDKGRIRGAEDGEVDMQVTFMPGLSETRNPEDENTLERYQRRVKEKRKKKEEVRKKGEVDDEKTKSNLDDEFFDVERDSHYEAEELPKQSKHKSAKPKKPAESSNAELALLAVSDNPHSEPTHFDMKAVLKSEKQGKKKSKQKRNREKDADGPGETQDDFVIDVKDDRFAAIHEDHRFAIDPTNPQFKKTKSMAALLNERSKRQKNNTRSDHLVQSQGPSQQSSRSLQSLVESIKRKNAAFGGGELGKRRKLGRS